MILPSHAFVAFQLSLILIGGAYPNVADQRPARYQSAHFALLAPAGHDMAGLLGEMERAYRDVRSYGLDLPATVQARSYGSTSDFVDGSGGSRFNLALARADVVHLQPVALLLARGELPRALRHELTHVALVKAARRGLPRWMNEGMAMAVAGEKLPETLRFRELRALEDTLARSRSYPTIRTAYGTAGRLVGVLIARFGRDKVLGLLERVAGGAAFEDAFTAIAGAAPADWARGELRR